MSTRKWVAGLLAVTVMAVSLPVQADSWKHERRHHDRDDGGDRECVYKRKQTPGMYKEEYKCRSRDGGHDRHDRHDRRPDWVGRAYHQPHPWIARAYPQQPPVMPFGFDSGNCNREMVGSLLGGGAGALLGSRIGEGSGKTAAMVGGTILGFMVGGSVGRSMDRIDQACMGQILEYAPNSQAIVWNNPANVRYEVVPMPGYQDRNGRYCREYQTTAMIGGRPQQLYGTACRQPDGSWQQVD